MKLISVCIYMYCWSTRPNPVKDMSRVQPRLRYVLVLSTIACPEYGFCASDLNVCKTPEDSAGVFLLK